MTFDPVDFPDLFNGSLRVDQKGLAQNALHQLAKEQFLAKGTPAFHHLATVIGQQGKGDAHLGAKAVMRLDAVLGQAEYRDTKGLEFGAQAIEFHHFIGAGRCTVTTIGQNQDPLSAQGRQRDHVTAVARQVEIGGGSTLSNNGGDHGRLLAFCLGLGM